MRAEILLPNFLEIRSVELMHAAARINSNPATRNGDEYAFEIKGEYSHSGQREPHPG
jgi:hypothetical protein